MGDEETKLADTTGKFAQVVSDGRKVTDLQWVSGRVLLSNKRLVLASNQGKKTVPLSTVHTVEGSQNNPSLPKVSEYLSVKFDSDVMLVSPADSETFERKLYAALLDGTVLLVKHPAVEGGVIQDTTWQKSRLKYNETSVDLATTDGQFVDVDLSDVGSVDHDERTVLGTERPLVEVEHTVEETSVETHLSGPTRPISVLLGLFRQVSTTESDVVLSGRENEVLLALYSGVSPFEISDFVGLDVDDVETIFDALVEKGVLERIRTRREVRLKARGRNIASDVTGEQ